MRISNIYKNIPEKIDNELFEELISSNSFKLERIISKGHATPLGEWYDQDMDELVFLLKGSASLRIHGEEKLIQLNEGDYIFLKAHLKHRVESTSLDKETIWLALHYRS